MSKFVRVESAFLNDIITFIEKEMPIDFEQHVLSKRLTHRWEGI